MIKNLGGVFGRNPTFNNVEVEGDLTVDGSIIGTVAIASTVLNPNLTGEVTTSGLTATVTNSAVIGKVITGYVSGAGTVAATDTILQAIQKLNGNAGAGIDLPVSIANGGTGKTTDKEAINALLPSQVGKSGKFLSTEGVNLLWADASIPAVPDADSLTGTELAPNVISSSLKSLGTLTNLSVENTIVGNVNTASQLLNTRAITLGGEASGTTNFDGSSNVTITTLIPLLDGGNF